MSVSLYYTAERDYPISEQEQEACRKVVERYNAEYPFGEAYEDFCVYDLDDGSFEENVIFEGATKLPPDEREEDCAEICEYWADCIQEIIDLLPDAQWAINIDDSDITARFDYPSGK